MIKIPICVQTIYICMSTILINRTEFVNANLLPKIDALARASSCTRSDVLRDIFYSSFNYSPLQRSKEQIEANCEIEISSESKCGKEKCIAVAIDSQFKDILIYYWVGCRGIYQQTVHHVLYNYFEEYPEGWSHKITNAKDAELRASCITGVTEPRPDGKNPAKGRVIVRKPVQVKA